MADYEAGTSSPCSTVDECSPIGVREGLVERSRPSNRLQRGLPGAAASSSQLSIHPNISRCNRCRHLRRFASCSYYRRRPRCSPDKLTRLIGQKLLWQAYYTYRAAIRRLTTKYDDEGRCVANGCLRVAIVPLLDTNTVCVSRAASNSRTCKYVKNQFLR